VNGLALLGIILLLYAVLVVVLAVKKPTSIWEMAKVRAFRKLLGEKGTLILFYVLAVVAAGFGIWLLAK